MLNDVGQLVARRVVFEPNGELRARQTGQIDHDQNQAIDCVVEGGSKALTLSRGKTRDMGFASWPWVTTDFALCCKRYP